MIYLLPPFDSTTPIVQHSTTRSDNTAGIERTDTVSFRADHSTGGNTVRSRIQHVKAEHAKKTGKVPKKAHKRGSVKTSGADTASNVGFASEHQDQSFPVILLHRLSSDIRCECALARPEPKAKSRNTKDMQLLPTLEELGFAVGTGNIIHRTYPKSPILHAHYRRSARDMSEQCRFKQYQEQKKEKQIQGELARVAKDDTKQHVVELTEAWQRTHEGQAITLHIKGQSHMRADRNIEERMAGQYGREREQELRGRYVLAPLPEFPQVDVDGGLVDMFSKLGLGSVTTASSSTAHGHGYGTFQHPCIDAAKMRSGQFPAWKIDTVEVAATFKQYIEAINERFIRACFLDPRAGCRPCVVSDAHKAATHLVQLMAHLPVSFIYDIIKHLAQAANTGAILQWYLDDIASAALEQAATTSRLLTGSTPSNVASSLTPSQRKVHGIIQKYEKLIQMNSTPLPTTPHFATLDLGWRKKMVWERYATTIDTVTEAKDLASVYREQRCLDLGSSAQGRAGYG